MAITMEMARHTGLILLNLGTPASCERRDVGNYLIEFLMDPRVIDIPWLTRAILVRGFIVPSRSRTSAALYRKVWTGKGSPLLFFTLRLAEQVQNYMGDGYAVLPAMRYGQPSIAGALTQMRAMEVDRVVLFPLYPQYSLAATESSVDAFHREAARILPNISRAVVPPFYNHLAYLDAVARVSRPHLGNQDKVVFSFHGLPVRQVKKTDATACHCFIEADCCASMVGANRLCYRAQSFYTARELIKRLGLGADKCEVAFQSRLGRTPWIKPYTDVLYQRLPALGVRRIAVLAPSFVADCLETLEEIQIRGREAFRAAGGEELTLVPSLNDDPAWVEAVAAIARPFLGEDLATSPARRQKSWVLQSLHPIQ